MSPNENNEKGYFESDRLYQLHTQLFASAATRWDDWLPMPKGWFGGPRADEFHERALTTMEEEFGQSRFFVLKDPRICRLVPFWGGVLEEFGAAPHYVLTHRNPLEVAASLHKRDGMPIGLGLLIWLRHLLDAEAGTRGQRRCFVNFAGLLTNWAGVVEHIQASLDISLPRFSLGVASEVESFLEGSLRHHREAPEKVLRNPMLSAWVRDSYEVFERWVERGEDSADYPQLDQIRAELDSSAPAFTQIVQSGREEVKRLSGENEALSENLDALRTEKADIVARVDELRGGVARREERVKTLEAELENAQTRILELDTARNDEKARKDKIAGERDQAKGRMIELQGELATLRADVEERERSHAGVLADNAREHGMLLAKQEVLTSELQELKDQLMQEQSALRQRSLEAEEANTALKALRADQAASAAELEELRETVATTEARLRDREALLGSQVASKTEKLNSLEVTLRGQYRELAEMTRILADKETEFDRAKDDAQQELQRERDAREKAEAQISDLAGRLEDSRRDVAEAKRAYEAKAVELERAEENAERDLTQERKSSTEAIRRERVARDAAEARASDLDSRLGTQFRELSEVMRFLSESEQALTNARVQSEAELTEIRGQALELESRRAEVEACLNEERSRASEREAQLLGQIDALRRSTSWRLTQPLRSVVGWFRGDPR